LGWSQCIQIKGEEGMPKLQLEIQKLKKPQEWMSESSESILSLLASVDFPSTSFIDGDFVSPESAGSANSRFSPIFGADVGELEYASNSRLDEAIASSRNAFDEGRWASMGGEERGALLVALGDLIRKEVKKLAVVEAIETGKPATGAEEIDIDEAANTFRWFGELSGKLGGETAPKGPFEILLREPLGVCACIAPFNYPLMITGWKIAPMLAAGNTVVLKPSEKTPGIALMLAKLAMQAGFPPGVLNVVIGDGETAGTYIASHKDTDAVGFTGSSNVALKVLQAAYSKRIKLAYVECGGKSPAIVMPDANIPEAAATIAGGTFYMAGQSCNAPTRAIVHEDKLDDFIAEIDRQLSDFRPNNPLSESTLVGALISKTKYDEVKEAIETDLKNGGKIVAGEFTNLSTSPTAAYVTPVCIAPSSNESTLVQTELFAPVLTIQTFQSVDDAISLANSTNYGLWASVWTHSLDVAKRVSREVSAGTVAVNDQFAGDISTPMGGIRAAGIGKDQGVMALEKYQVVKHASLG
jgi:gamma-glutamyl-gamma-aminobutyraldehyde dehydrogenase